MKKVDLHRLGRDQVVARSITLHPIGEVDEAGAESRTFTSAIIFNIGDMIRIILGNTEKIIAYKNCGMPPNYGLPPYAFRREELEQIMVQD